MSLSAIYNGKTIYSFTYCEREWNELKNTYRQNSLKMSCCNQQAIPKTHNNGTLFFAHSRRGECLVDNDTTIRLYIKFIIGRVANKNGFFVQENYSTQPMIGGELKSDIFCNKDDLEITFQLYFVNIPRNREFVTWQQPYNLNNIMNISIADISEFKNIFRTTLPYDKDTPVFGFQYDKNTERVIIPQFNCDFETFINGFFSKKLEWDEHKKEWVFDGTESKFPGDDIPSLYRK